MAGLENMLSHHLSWHCIHHEPDFQPAARRCSREASIRPAPWPEAQRLGRRLVTPRQACPWPNGFGRNLRSKTRWFTGFCNSHQVSHFATFFIDARAEISVAESRFGLECCGVTRTGTVTGPTGRAVRLLLPWRIPRRGLLLLRRDDRAAESAPPSRRLGKASCQAASTVPGG